MPYFIDRLSGDFGFMTADSFVIVDEFDQFTDEDTERLAEMTDLERTRYAEAYKSATWRETPSEWVKRRTEQLTEN